MQKLLFIDEMFKITSVCRLKNSFLEPNMYILLECTHGIGRHYLSFWLMEQVRESKIIEVYCFSVSKTHVKFREVLFFFFLRELWYYINNKWKEKDGRLNANSFPLANKHTRVVVRLTCVWRDKVTCAKFISLVFSQFKPRQFQLVISIAIWVSF